MKKLVLFAAVSAVPFAAFAQVAVPTGAPIQAVASPPVRLVLPAGTEITLTPNSDMTSKHHKAGDTFAVSTVFDVMYNGYIVIPKDTQGQAKIGWRTGKGAFGKSAKMDIVFEWLDLGGRHVALSGTHRQEGEGNTGATIGTLAAAGVVGAVFVTGKSAKIPHGMQMSARLAESLPIILPEGARPTPSATIMPATGIQQAGAAEATKSTN